MRDGKSYIAPSHLSFRFLYLTEDHVQVNLASGYAHTDSVKARRQLGTGDVRSKHKKEAWHRLCLIKSAFK